MTRIAPQKTLPIKQQGAALIIAMLILSIVVVITATMTVEHNFHVRRVSNQLAASQVYGILRGTEAFAYKALAVDAKLDDDNGLVVDNVAEFWAGEKDFIFDEVLFRGELIDLQGRFNLNSLLVEHVKGDPIPSNNSQAIFIRLLQTFELEEGVTLSYDEAQDITEAIVDYIDPDEDYAFGCGEDSGYFSIENRAPHRTANQAFHSVSELRLICNLPVAIYRQLVPIVTVWPVSGEAGFNINTASVNLLQAILLPDDASYKAVRDDKKYPTAPFEMSIDQKKELQMAQGFVARDEGGIGDTSEGWDKHDAAQTYFAQSFNNAKLWPTTSLVLGSNYFLLVSDGKLADVNIHLESVISREGGTIQILARSTGGL